MQTKLAKNYVDYLNLTIICPKSLPHYFGIYGHATLLVSQIGHGEIGRSASDKIFETKGLADVHQIMYEQRDNFLPKCVPP